MITILAMAGPATPIILWWLARTRHTTPPPPAAAYYPPPITDDYVTRELAIIEWHLTHKDTE